MPLWPLTALDVHAFRGLREVAFTGLGRINLLVGGTNSGKTSVLEALSLLSEPLDPLLWVQVANRREPSPLAAMTSSKVDRLRFLFPAGLSGPEQFAGPVRLSFQGTSPIKSIDATVKILRGVRPTISLMELEDGTTGQVSTETERSGLEVTVTLGTAQTAFLPEIEPTVTFQAWDGESLIGKDRPAKYKLPVRVITPYEHWLRAPATRGFSEATLSGHEKESLELLKLIEPSILSVRVLATQREPMLYLEDARAGFLPINSFGDGIRRVLTLALALPRASGGLLLIDEIETGLHISMLAKVYGWVVRACTEFNVQIFATTHSLEALDALLDADTTEDEDTVGFYLGRDQTQKSVIKRFGENQLKRLRRERGLDVR